VPLTSVTHLALVLPLRSLQLFGGKLESTSLEPISGRLDPRRNLYDSFSTSMLTTFVVISVEDWNDYMVVTKRAVGGWVSVYYVVLIIVGNYLVLNLVVAVVISGYVDASEQQLKCVPLSPSPTAAA
jgi:hypothetical protein